MSKTIKIGINWTRSAITLVLLCAVFSFSAAAQSDPDERLDAEAVAALVEELADGLPDLIEDEAAVETVTDKWGKRQDLAAKTRIQILKMLFADVRSVVEDKETQDKIWKSWTEAEKSEDETPVETPKPQPTPVETPKPIIWVKVVNKGAYIARFNLTWDEPNKPNIIWDSGGKTIGFEQRIDLPGNATNIRLKIEAMTGLVWDPWGGVINKVLQPNELNRCYRAYGTTLSRHWDNNCQ